MQVPCRLPTQDLWAAKPATAKRWSWPLACIFCRPPPMQTAQSSAERPLEATPQLLASSELADQPWTKPVERVLSALEVDSTKGLSTQQVQSRLEAFGANELRAPKTAHSIDLLIAQFRGVLVLLLAIAAGISFALGDWVEALAILSVLVINAALGFATELRAVRSMEALRGLGAPTSRVVRDGKQGQVASSTLVPGDIVIVEAGDRLGADVRVTQSAQLQVDESSLTGESLPVGKSSAALERADFVGDRSCMLHSGTTVTAGTGKGVVCATGHDAEVGKIATMVAGAQPDETTPLEKRLNKLAQTLLWFTLAIAAIVALIGIAAGKPVSLVLETAIALAVASVPEGLPVLATMILARGVHRMAKNDALVQKLSAVETLGATGIICTDKTGTLTENRMTVDAVEPPDGVLSTSDEAYLRAVSLGAWCNNASLGVHGEEATGDPLEIALLQAAAESDVPTAPKRLREVAFDPRTRMMATIHEVDGERVAIVKGAPEAVLGVSRSTTNSDAWLARATTMASNGLRVIAIAQRTLPNLKDDPYKALEPIALIGLLDPPRPDVADAISACRQAGISLRMMTGDHPQTAAHIAKRLRISDRVSVLTGSELAELSLESEADLQIIREATVFARVSPEQKLSLIQFYQKEGHVVAMTGDGVNDAPALRKADIGVAMGLRGTEVAREASEVVLLNDAFSTIVMAIREGRGVFANIRNFVVYLLSCNLSEILVVGLATAVKAPLPLLPLQILFLNLVTDVFPALALGATETEESVMRRPPRPPEQSVLGRSEWRRILGYGCVITVAVLSAFFYTLYELETSIATAVSVAFLSLALGQLWHVFNMAPPGAGVLRNQVVRNGLVWGALALCLLLLTAAMYWPPAARILSLVPLSREPLAVALVASALPLIAGIGVRSVGQWKRREKHAELTL